MTVLQETYVQEAYADSAEFTEVVRVRDSLLDFLNTPDALAEIEMVNRPKVSSAKIQAVLLEFARELGFQSESKGLFAHYPTPGLRPDYFLPMNHSGILLEVERGKSTINNMDFLDLWKCHICPVADYLFLLVPQSLVQNDKNVPRKEYVTVCKRMSSFFIQGNYTNVRGISIFGY